MYIYIYNMYSVKMSLHIQYLGCWYFEIHDVTSSRPGKYQTENVFFLSWPALQFFSIANKRLPILQILFLNS